MQTQIWVKRSQTAEAIEANFYCILPAVYKTEADVQLTRLTISQAQNRERIILVNRFFFKIEFRIGHLETVDLIQRNQLAFNRNRLETTLMTTKRDWPPF